MITYFKTVITINQYFIYGLVRLYCIDIFFLKPCFIWHCVFTYSIISQVELANGAKGDKPGNRHRSSIRNFTVGEVQDIQIVLAQGFQYNNRFVAVNVRICKPVEIGPKPTSLIGIWNTRTLIPASECFASLWPIGSRPGRGWWLCPMKIHLWRTSGKAHKSASWVVKFQKNCLFKPHIKHLEVFEPG